MLRRVMGKLAFITLRDGSGDVQLYMDRSIMNEQDTEAFRCASMWLMIVWIMMELQAGGLIHMACLKEFVDARL